MSFKRLIFIMFFSIENIFLMDYLQPVLAVFPINDAINFAVCFLFIYQLENLRILE